MTNEEAKELIKSQIDIAKDNISYCPNEEGIEALNLAIKALEEQPSEDCISRQAALDTIGNVPDYDDGMVWEALSHAQRDVALLPPVTPQRLKGKWVDKQESEKEDSE